MKKTILIPILLCAITIFAQEKNQDLQKQQQELVSLNQKLNNQQVIISQQKNELAKLSAKTENQNKLIDSLKIETNKNVQNIRAIANDLGTKIQQTETTAKDSISKLDKDVNTNRLYWIIATLVTLLLGGVIYWLLGKRIATSKTDVETQIKNTKKSLEEESIKLDSKLIEVLDTQLKLKQEEKQITSANSNIEIDHSLALKVADEIVRIHKNLQQMDSSTKGLKQLSASVQRIQDNFASNGYELVEMLGKEYNEGMKVIANFIPSEDIETGKQIITRIIKPQVNYKEQMIQSAQIEVSIGEK
ncbi:putative RNase H-like nuclease (RuvC/YqgF family) [Flavobacterium sp. 28A]|uniref:type VII secretion EssA family protein n=1 Tax=Flavobacterium sp. 28A TaxID=2735895 RepID=UPI00156FD906|nr:type VII secretion EssA family protein [Flavobacterium sp. 28A]NRT14796.1 putative RNase H-like nuclease (RuvC/YqgF family) [Flavobacterium sp. 28A]